MKKNNTTREHNFLDYMHYDYHYYTCNQFLVLNQLSNYSYFTCLSLTLKYFWCLYEFSCFFIVIMCGISKYL